MFHPAPTSVSSGSPRRKKRTGYFSFQSAPIRLNLRPSSTTGVGSASRWGQFRPSGGGNGLPGTLSSGSHFVPERNSTPSGPAGRRGTSRHMTPSGQYRSSSATGRNDIGTRVHL